MNNQTFGQSIRSRGSADVTESHKDWMAGDNNGTSYYWPNKMGRMLLLALEDVMGINGVNAVLNLAKLRHRVNNYPINNLELEFDFEELSKIMQALEDMYGPRSGRSLAIRSGRAGFKYGLRDFGSLLGLADLAFRLLPLSMKLRVGLNAMGDTFNNFTDQRVRVEEGVGHFVYSIDRCPVCWSRHTDQPCCYAATGLLQEMLTWISNGKSFDIQEVACIATGDSACTFVIDKHPRG
jgi:predicted hydrocarbon binding protein